MTATASEVAAAARSLRRAHERLAARSRQQTVAVLGDVIDTWLAPGSAWFERAVAAYPYPRSYRIWPGPNSNTFTAFVLREVPELRVDLPGHAIGKDYLGTRVFARSPSGTGVQASLFGLLGVLGGVEEGLEVNVLGATVGIDPNDLDLKLPLVGRFGFGGRAPRYAEQGE